MTALAPIAVAASEDARTEMKYRAPALEKGLDILELLANADGPMTPTRIAADLGKSLSEIFRMLLVLEARGYIADEAGDGYWLTERLFSLGIKRAPARALLSVAAPIMEALAAETDQSVHLTVLSGDQIVVVARVEGPGDLGFSVKLGYRRPMTLTLSGAMLFGMATALRKAAIEALLAAQMERDQLEAFVQRAQDAARDGFVVRQSRYVQGVQDIVAPIVQNGGAIATLVVPFLMKTSLKVDLDEAVVCLRRAAMRISSELYVGGQS